jgi:hypothetical protein
MKAIDYQKLVIISFLPSRKQMAYKCVECFLSAEKRSREGLALVPPFAYINLAGPRSPSFVSPQAAAFSLP